VGGNPGGNPRATSISCRLIPPSVHYSGGGCINDLEILVKPNLSGMVGSSLRRRLLEHFELGRIPRLSRRNRLISGLS